MSLAAWLSTLEPPENSGLATAIELKCFLMRSDHGSVRIAVGELCLVIARGDVIDVAEVQLPDGVDPLLGIPVELKLRKPCRILDLSSGLIYSDTLLRGQRPFALASRRGQTIQPVNQTYRALEREFLLKYGIELDQ